MLVPGGKKVSLPGHRKRGIKTGSSSRVCASFVVARTQQSRKC
jgi:hypothetical protein